MKNFQKSLNKKNHLLKKKVQKETKTAREPSAYNIFMKDKIPELKIKYPTKEHSEIFKEAAKLWREKSS